MMPVSTAQTIRPRRITAPRVGRWVLSVLVCVVLLAGGLAIAPTASAQPRGLSKFESRAYVIHTNLTRKEALEYGIHMDRIYKEYSQRFAVLRGEDRGKMDLYLLRTRQDYIRAMATFGIRAEASGGMFFWGPGVSGMSTWVEGHTRDQVYNTLQHEGFHQFAHAKMGENLPLWVNEGLAEYFGAAIVVDGDVQLGVVDADRIDKINLALERNQALTFNELLNIESAQWHDNMLTGSPKGSLQYDQSWATVHFLIHGDRGKYKSAFGDYLVLLSRGRNHRQAWSQTFGNDNRRFAERWRVFMDEVEPDAYSTALKRLQFLGSGLQFLHEQGQPTPADVEGLREALQSRGYKLTWVTEAGERTIDSADEDLYFYLDRRDAEHGFEIIPAEEDSGLPAMIGAPKLKPAVTLTWVEDDEGNIRSQLDYGRRRR